MADTDDPSSGSRAARTPIAPERAYGFYRSLFDLSRDGCAVLDLDGNVRLANPAFARLLGYTLEELESLSVRDWDAQWTADELAERVQALAAEDATFETVHRRRDGSLYDVEVSVNPFEFEDERLLFCIHRDISARKRAEADLRGSRERFSAIFDGTSNALAFTEPASGRIIDVNRAWVESMGIDRDEAIGRSALELGLWKSADDRTMCLERLDEGRARGIELELVTRHGLRPFLVSAGIISVRDQPHGLWEFRDLRAARQAQQEKERLQAQLVEAQKMEAIGQLAGGIAHDFNNILQVIGGNAEIARVELAPGHPAAEPLLDLMSAAGRAKALVEQLLASGRRQILRPEALALNEVVAHVLAMVTRVIGEHIRVTFIPGHQLGGIWADRSMVEQVLLNLCLNARDAIGSSGTVTVETDNVLIDERFCETNPWARPGRYVLLVVSDSGCGMDAATQARIFEPFFTTKDRQKGTGLGLSVVYGIVRQHDGMINVHSEPGRGATFKVYFPVSERLALTATARGDSRPARGSERVLAAEDDPAVRLLLKRVLESAGYRVSVAGNGQEAAALFAGRPDEFDVVVLDVVMPELGGREAYERMKAVRPDIPVLFTSGYSENAVDVDFVLKPGMRLIQKPYAADDLLRAIRQVLDAQR
jgi:two-component system, cell cycle sensor histidine kinase and response regulator CckA